MAQISPLQNVRAAFDQLHNAVLMFSEVLVNQIHAVS